MNKRFTASYKLAIGFAALALLVTYGYKFANDMALGEKLPPIKPSVVNIVGVDTSAGYHIVVQNQIAKLVQGGPGTFGPGDMSGDSEASDPQRKFVPIKEMLGALSGDKALLGEFVMKINEIQDTEWPVSAPIWTSQNIEKAIDGDKTLKSKLEANLNMHLDGSPLDHVDKDAMFDGIFVDIDVPIKLKNGEVLQAPVRQWYRPALVTNVTEVRVKSANKYYTMKDVATAYASAAEEEAQQPARREKITRSLRSLYSPEKMGQLETAPERFINSVIPVLNENQIESAKELSLDGSKGKVFTLVFKLSEEGKKRIWQFTRDRVGSQLLVVVNGVAIAAPRIDHGINGDEVEINNLEDESMIQETIDTLKEQQAKSNR